MLVRENFIRDTNGNFMMNWEEDSQAVADQVADIKTRDGWTGDRSARLMMSIPVHEFYEWEKRVGKGCWQDKDFQTFYKKFRPEFKV